MKLIVFIDYGLDIGLCENLRFLDLDLHFGERSKTSTLGMLMALTLSQIKSKSIEQLSLTISPHGSTNCTDQVRLFPWHILTRPLAQPEFALLTTLEVRLDEAPGARGPIEVNLCAFKDILFFTGA
jgi:hypothetical protein